MDFIDAHHHTWDHRVFPYPGVNDPHPIGDISHFKENYLITDLLDDAKNQNLIKSVHVECGGGGKDNGTPGELGPQIKLNLANLY